MGTVQAVTLGQSAPFVCAQAGTRATDIELGMVAQSAAQLESPANLPSQAPPAACSSEHLVCAPLWDWRFGEAVLGRWGVKYTSATKVTVNGREVSAASLEQKDYLRQLCGGWGCGRLDIKGQLERVDIALTRGADNAGSISAVDVVPAVVRAGNSVEFTMRAVPRRQVTFFVGGLGQELAAKETAPGVYRVKWKAPNVDARGLRVMGQLTERDKRAVCWGTSFDVVASPPEIGNCGASWVNDREVMVFAQYESAGTSIDPQQVRVWVEDREVTGKFQRTDRGALGVLLCTEASPGMLCCVKVTDRSGQSVKRYWRIGAAGAPSR